MLLKLYFTLLLCQPIFSQELVDFVHRNQQDSREACCMDSFLKSCTDVRVNPDLLGQASKLNIKGIELSFDGEVPPNGYVYKSPQGDEAVLSFNWQTGNLFGSLHTEDGRSFMIEKCNNGHVWKEFDVSSFPQEEDGIYSEFFGKFIF